MRSLISLLSIVVFVIGSASAQIDAQKSFEDRQKDLVRLARHLGSLHRYHQLCSSYRPDLYRDRLQQIIKMEVPMGATRLDMIAAFNSSYRSASRLHLSCGSIAQGEQEQAAKNALIVVERLYAPFR